MANIVNFNVDTKVMSVGGNVMSLKSQGITINRTNPIPLEQFEIFNTLADAKKYAASNPVAYAGQQITVVEETGVGTGEYNVQAYIVAGTEQADGSWLIPLSQGANMSDIEIAVWEDWNEEQPVEQ